MNPFKILPPKVRQSVYLAAVVVGLGVTAWQAADHDVVEALGGFCTALLGAMAASNVKSSDEV